MPGKLAATDKTTPDVTFVFGFRTHLLVAGRLAGLRAPGSLGYAKGKPTRTLTREQPLRGETLGEQHKEPQGMKESRGLQKPRLVLANSSGLGDGGEDSAGTRPVGPQSSPVRNS